MLATHQVLTVDEDRNEGHRDWIAVRPGHPIGAEAMATVRRDGRRQLYVVRRCEDGALVGTVTHRPGTDTVEASTLWRPWVAGGA